MSSIIYVHDKITNTIYLEKSTKGVTELPRPYYRRLAKTVVSDLTLNDQHTTVTYSINGRPKSYNINVKTDILCIDDVVVNNPANFVGSGTLYAGSNFVIYHSDASKDGIEVITSANPSNMIELVSPQITPPTPFLRDSKVAPWSFYNLGDFDLAFIADEKGAPLSVGMLIPYNAKAALFDADSMAIKAVFGHDMKAIPLTDGVSSNVDDIQRAKWYDSALGSYEVEIDGIVKVSKSLVRQASDILKNVASGSLFTTLDRVYAPLPNSGLPYYDISAQASWYTLRDSLPAGDHAAVDTYYFYDNLTNMVFMDDAIKYGINQNIVRDTFREIKRAIDEQKSLAANDLNRRLNYWDSQEFASLRVKPNLDNLQGSDILESPKSNPILLDPSFFSWLSINSNMSVNDMAERMHQRFSVSEELASLDEMHDDAKDSLRQMSSNLLNLIKRNYQALTDYANGFWNQTKLVKGNTSSLFKVGTIQNGQIQTQPCNDNDLARYGSYSQPEEVEGGTYIYASDDVVVGHALNSDAIVNRQLTSQQGTTQPASAFVDDTDIGWNWGAWSGHTGSRCRVSGYTDTDKSGVSLVDVAYTAAGIYMTVNMRFPTIQWFQTWVPSGYDNVWNGSKFYHDFGYSSAYQNDVRNAVANFASNVQLKLFGLNKKGELRSVASLGKLEDFQVKTIVTDETKPYGHRHLMKTLYETSASCTLTFEIGGFVNQNIFVDRISSDPEVSNMTPLKNYLAQQISSALNDKFSQDLVILNSLIDEATNIWLYINGVAYPSTSPYSLHKGVTTTLSDLTLIAQSVDPSITTNVPRGDGSYYSFKDLMIKIVECITALMPDKEGLTNYSQLFKTARFVSSADAVLLLGGI